MKINIYFGLKLNLFIVLVKFKIFNLVKILSKVLVKWFDLSKCGLERLEKIFINLDRILRKLKINLYIVDKFYNKLK